MKVNIALTALANVFALINAANPGKNFSETNVTLGTPTAFAGNGGRNSQIQVTAIQNAGYSGSYTAQYTRQALASGEAIATAKDLPVELLPADSDAEVLTKVATALGLLESELTISNVVKATNEDTPGSATVTAIATSFLYTGVYTVALTTADTDVPLSEAMVNNDLDGFDPEG